MEHTLIKLPSKQCVCGINISTTSYDEVVDLCSQWIDEKRRSYTQVPSRYICVTSVHGVMEAREDLELREVLNHADVATPDGMPVVWALRSFGQREQQRVYGPTLMLRLCERAEREQLKVFLYGSTDEVLERLTDSLRAKFPRIQITGTYSPPFRALTQEEDETIRQRIREAGADLVFVGVSTPKQEKWMARQQRELSGVVMVGVGAAFDFHAGRVKQAPKWMQERGLEWLFRLLSEPKRLWRRYILVTPRFLPYWALQLSGVTKYKDMPQVQPHMDPQSFNRS